MQVEFNALKVTKKDEQKGRIDWSFAVEGSMRQPGQIISIAEEEVVINLSVQNCFTRCREQTYLFAFLAANVSAVGRWRAA